MPMRPTRVRLAANGVSPWVPLNRYATDISVLLALMFSSNANLTAGVQFTPDPLEDQLISSLTRVTTTATLALTNHGLSVSDSVVVSGGGAPFDGTFAVASVPNQNSITYAVPDSGNLIGAGPGLVKTLRVLPHEVLWDLTADAASNIMTPVPAIRLIVSNYTAGYVDLDIISGSK